MARRLGIVLLLALGAYSCGGEPAPPPSATATSPTTTPPTATVGPSASETPSSTPTPGADVRLPPRAPATLGEDLPAGDLPTEAIAPSGAAIGSRWTTPAGDDVQSVAFTWARGADPFAAQTGFEVWERFPGQDPPWRATYAFTDGPRSGVLGVTFETGDLTDDGSPDALTFEDIGGSGACGTWRVVEIGPTDAAEIYSKQTCDTQVQISGGDLEIRAAVYGPGDAHCCPSAYRTTRLHWTGAGWRVVERKTEPA